MKTWYLKFPTSLYKESTEEILKIASDNGFRIIDAKYGSNDEEVPKLTLVSAPDKGEEPTKEDAPKRTRRTKKEMAESKED
jgi:hypothetical protein